MKFSLFQITLLAGCSLLPFGQAWAVCNGGTTVTGTLVVSANCDGGHVKALTLGTGAAVTINNGVTIQNEGTGNRNGDTLSIAASSTASSLINKGTIYTISQWAVSTLGSGATLTSLTNFGTIASGTWLSASSGTRGIANQAGGTIGTLTNVGIIYGPFSDVTNAGTIGTFNNLQGASNAAGAITYTSALPTNYNMIINSPSVYGQLSNDGATGGTAFNIYGNTGTTMVSGAATSKISAGTTYADVLQGFTTLSGITGTSGNYGSLTYSLVADMLNSGDWNLVISSGSTNITAGMTGSSANLGTTFNPKLDGGTLQVASAGTIATALTLTTNNGTIDQNGVASTFSGAISNDTIGQAGKLIITNSGSGGSVTLAHANSYTGGTEVNAGTNLTIASGSYLGSGTLALVGGVSTPATLSTTANTTISNNITVAGDPIFNVSTGTTTIISGAITDGASSGDVTVQGGGTLNLTNTNTYTGPTSVTGGSTLEVTGSGAITNTSSITIGGDGSASTLLVSGSSNVTGAITVGETGTGGGANLTVNGGTQSGAITVDSGGSVTANSISLSSGSMTGAVTLNGNATLTMTGGSFLGAMGADNGNISISGGGHTGAITTTGTSTISISGGASNAGAISIASGGAITIAGSSTSVTGGITTNGSATFSMSGGGVDSLTTSSGTATSTLSGGTLSSYNGDGSSTLNVSGGTLSAFTLAGSSTINASAGTLGGGTISGASSNFVIANGSTATLTGDIAGGGDIGFVTLLENWAPGARLGTSGETLHQIEIFDGKTLTLSHDIYATETYLGSGGSGATLMTNADNIHLGTIDGTQGFGASYLGTLNINNTIATSGDIGANTPLAAVNVHSGGSLTSTNNITANAITIAGGGALTQTSGAITGSMALASGASYTYNGGSYSGAIDGSGGQFGTVTINNDYTSGGAIGSTNGIAALNVTNGTTTLNDSVKAATVTISGTNTRVKLSANQTITGNAVLDSTDGLMLRDNSTVTGTIKGNAAGDGILFVGFLGYGTPETITTQNDIGGGGKAIGSVNVLQTNTFDLSTNNNSVTTTAGIYLYHDTDLKIGSGIITGDVLGYIPFNASGNGTGGVSFMDNYTLAGNIGTNNGNSLNTVSIASGKSVDTGSYEINATNIDLASNATLTTAQTISGGGDVTTGLNRTATAISLASGASLVLNNGAHIIGNINGNADGLGTITFNGTQTMDGNIGSMHPISALDISPGAVIHVNGDVTADTNTITGSLHVNGNINGDITVGSGGEFGGNNTVNGNLILGSGASLAPGNSIGTVHVVGNTTFNTGSTYQVQVSGNQIDLLTATGNITIQPGVTLDIVPLATVTGSSLTFLQAGGTLTGKFDIVDLGGLAETVVYNTSTSSLDFLSINPLSVNTQALAAFDTSTLFTDTVSDNAAASAFERKDNAWIKGIDRENSHQTNGIYTGFNNNIYGTAFGAEHPLANSWKIGFSLADLENDANIKNSLGKDNGNSAFAAVYGTYVKPVTAKWDMFSTFGLTGGTTSFDSQRLVSNSGFASQADAHTNAYEAGALASLGARTPVGSKGWYAAPQINVDYTHIFAQGYTEKSGGLAAVSIDNYDFGTLRPELKLSLYNNDGFTVPGTHIIAKPNFNVGMFHEYATTQRDVGGAFSDGTRFNLNLDGSNSTFATAGVGIDFDIMKNVTAFMHYQGSSSHDEKRNDAKIGVKLEF